MLEDMRETAVTVGDFLAVPAQGLAAAVAHRQAPHQKAAVVVVVWGFLV